MYYSGMKFHFLLLALLLSACASSITSYEECIEAGHAMMKSYPPQCSDGENVFVQNLGNIREKSDIIRLSSPLPGERITSPLTVKGEARGTWFFEANFTVTLRMTNNEEIITYAVADGDWMTEDFVPFTAVIESTFPSSGNAFLILRKANASGLPENDDALIVPVRF